MEGLLKQNQKHKVTHSYLSSPRMGERRTSLCLDFSNKYKEKLKRHNPLILGVKSEDLSYLLVCCMEAFAQIFL